MDRSDWYFNLVSDLCSILAYCTDVSYLNVIVYLKLVFLHRQLKAQVIFAQRADERDGKRKEQDQGTGGKKERGGKEALITGRRNDVIADPTPTSGFKDVVYSTYPLIRTCI